MIASPQTEIFKRYIDPDFPDLEELAANCPLVMVNSDEVYAFPRPILHKIVYIGGLGMRESIGKPLTGVSSSP